MSKFNDNNQKISAIDKVIWC